MVKRFEFDFSYVPFEDAPIYSMKECSYGEYVRHDDYATLEARIAELEKDAARYRWLRDSPWSSDEFGIRFRVAIQFQMNAVWDEVIDDAMSREA